MALYSVWVSTLDIPGTGSNLSAAVVCRQRAFRRGVVFPPLSQSLPRLHLGKLNAIPVLTDSFRTGKGSKNDACAALAGSRMTAHKKNRFSRPLAHST